MIRDPGLRYQIGRAARQDVEKRFSPAGQAALLADLIRRVLAEKVEPKP
jgi:glycosyltransferase involved in cell wall biosynthesis